MIRPGDDQVVVFAEAAPRHGHRLNADEPSHLAAQGADEGLALPQAVDRLEPVHVFEVVAGVQMGEDRSGFVPGRARHLDDVMDGLPALFVDAEVLPVVQNLQACEGELAQ